MAFLDAVKLGTQLDRPARLIMSIPNLPIGLTGAIDWSQRPSKQVYHPHQQGLQQIPRILTNEMLEMYGSALVDWGILARMHAW